MKFERLILIIPSIDTSDSSSKGKKLESEDDRYKEFLDEAVKHLGIKLELIEIKNNDLKFKEIQDGVVIYNSEKEVTVKYSDKDNTVLWFKQDSLYDNRNYLYDLDYIFKFNNFVSINYLEDKCISANKGKTFEVFEKNNIPQPKSFLLKFADTETPEKFYEKLRTIYPKKSDDNTYVVKVLGGHGGTGVFMITENRIHSVMQALYEVLGNIGKADKQFLIQKKEDAKDGDIRVHVLTINGKQKIIGAIRRHKVGNDFRSNISLGAQASPVKLTKEQEDIAKKVAKCSNLLWCAVDIMELTDGSNVVLEYNSSPGTGGVSRTLKCNFVEELLKNVKEMCEETSSDTDNNWLKTVKEMYTWYTENVHRYSTNHNNDQIFCDLLNKNIKADCSGFIGACLCKAGYTDDPINWNVKFGSFNDNGRRNNDDKPYNCDVENLKYMKDLKDWGSHDFAPEKIKAGDIIYSSFHVTIAADDGAKHLYDWGNDVWGVSSTIEHNGNEPVEFYQHEYKFRAYWRLKDE